MSDSLDIPRRLMAPSLGFVSELISGVSVVLRHVTALVAWMTLGTLAVLITWLLLFELGPAHPFLNIDRSGALSVAISVVFVALLASLVAKWRPSVARGMAMITAGWAWAVAALWDFSTPAAAEESAYLTMGLIVIAVFFVGVFRPAAADVGQRMREEREEQQLVTLRRIIREELRGAGLAQGRGPRSDSPDLGPRKDDAR
ncbi:MULTISPECIES: hypothetical protein [unclassified Microbacterium]|uniref:hypothetical protein n=1 Tax=unclassified Microbacterium TaxID=2609290 RepID=UPI003019F335